MPNRLKNIEIDEISFVDCGASGDDIHRPKTTFWKRNMPTFLESLKGMFAKAEGEPEMSVDQIKAELMGRLSDEDKALFVMFLERALATDAAAVPPAPPAEPAADAEPEPKPEEDDPMDLGKLRKSNPELADRIAKLQSDNDALTKANRENAEAVAELKKAKRVAEFRKAVGKYTYLAADLDEVAAMLEEADRSLSDEAKETLTKVLRTSEGIVKKAKDGKPLFFEKGSSRPSDNDTGVADQKAAAVAKIREANPELTEQQAIAKAIRANPELGRALRGVEMGGNE